MTAHLPPLPAVGGETTGSSITDIVAREHRDLLALCAELTSGEGTDQARRRKVAQVVVGALSRHLSAAEQYLYPAVNDLGPEGPALAARGLAQDRELLEALRRLDADLESPERAAEVGRLLERHAHTAAQELRPLLHREASIEDLHRLGNRFETAEESAPTRPHPGTPARPPWNKIVDPVVAVADKARDLVSWRTTYPKDL